MNKVKLCTQFAENECGLCCVSMITSFFGEEYPISYFRKKANVGRDGISLLQLKKIFEECNYNCTVYKCNFFDESMVASNPIIMHQRNSHYVVIVREKKKIVKYDPSTGRSIVSKSDLEHMFSGYYLIAKPLDNHKQRIKNSPYKYFISKITQEYKSIFAIFLISILAYITSVYIPVLISGLMNAVVYGDISSIYYSVIERILLVIMLFAILSFFRNHYLLKMQMNLVTKINTDMIYHLLHINYSYFENRTNGEIQFRVSLIDQVKNSISYDFVNLIFSLSNIIVITVYIMHHYTKVIISVTLITIISTSLFAAFAQRCLQKSRRRFQKESASLKEIENQLISNMYQIKCINVTDVYNVRFNNTLRQYTDTYGKDQKAIQTFSLIFNLLFTYIPFLIIVFFIFEEDVKVGGLFTLYSFLTTLFSQCFTCVSNISSIGLLRESLSYVNDILDEEEENNNRQTVNGMYLSVKNVSFRYSDNSNYVLNNISFEMNMGQFIAIVGNSGSGKTTLVKLLAKLYSPTIGSIMLNGINISEIGSVCDSKVSILPQKPLILNSTIRENISMKKKDCSDTDIWNALEYVGLTDNLYLPMGLDTIISDSRATFSGGQLQRINLARELICSPNLLIFDEALSSIEQNSEINIYKKLINDGYGIMVITHRLDVIRKAANILVIDKGNIVASGDYNSLSAKCDCFKKMIVEDSFA